MEHDGTEQVRRYFRLTSILRFAGEVGMVPLDIALLHTIAYLADALAPAWEIPALDSFVLKRRGAPFFPRLQSDLDRLVGMGVVGVSDVTYVQDNGNKWRLEARYSLDLAVSDRIMATASQLTICDVESKFLREVLYAVAGLGADGLLRLGDVDAAYANSVIDYGQLIDLDDPSRMNPTAAVARRFGEMGAASASSRAEQTQLYVRHLYARLHVA